MPGSRDKVSQSDNFRKLAKSTTNVPITITSTVGIPEHRRISQRPIKFDFRRLLL